MNRSLDEKLHRICQEESVHELKTYLQHGITSKINHGELETGDTPLHVAAQARSPTNSCELAGLLLEYGANPSSRNSTGETPAHRAARSGNLTTLKLLVEKGGLSGMLNQQRNLSGSGGPSGIRRSTYKAQSLIKRHLSTRTREAASTASSKPTSAQESGSKNILLAACESESVECVEYLLDEIVSARKNCLVDDDKDGYGGVYVGGQEVMAPTKSTILDVREFLAVTQPRQLVFLELGADLAASNLALTTGQMERSIYGKMLAKTPKAFQYLLDSCIYTRGRRTYVDFFPFFNPEGSELNILRIIIHFKKFELLTHPVCEMFLHLKWLRARWLYWIVIFVYLLFSLQVIAYTLLNYGELAWYFDRHNGTYCPQDQSDNIGSSKDPLYRYPGSMSCIGAWFRIPLIVSAAPMFVVQFVKLFQDRGVLLSAQFWLQRPEDFIHFLVIFLICIDQLPMAVNIHKLISAVLVLGCCRIMMNVIARDPDIAIFVEMISNTQKSLFKFFLSYIWLFVGWIVAFHVTLGDNKLTASGQANSFHDLGSTTAKVLSMFTGELGFETSFLAATSLAAQDPVYNSFIIVFFAFFIMEMCVILMNLTIGLAISNIQDLRQNADALRLVKEVVLQRYMESLLRLPSLSPIIYAVTKSFPRDLAHLVTPELFQSDANYCLCQTRDCDASRLSLVLCRKDQKNSTQHKSVPVPSTVVCKLQRLLQGLKEDKRKDQDSVSKKMLMDIKSDVEALKRTLAKLVAVTTAANEQAKA